MKKLLLPALAGMMALVSCQEKAPRINLTEREVTDTSYMAAVETPQTHKILVEEFTGASCANCPAAHELLKSLKEQYPDRLIAIAMHINNFPQSNPLPGSMYDFRTIEGTDVAQSIYGGVNSMPTAGIDRVLPAGSDRILMDSRKWAIMISDQLAVTTPVNIDVTSSYDAAEGMATIQVKLAYTEDVATNQNLSVVILHDKLVDKQEYTDHEVEGYDFNSIFRDMVTPLYGNPILPDTVKKAGLVCIRTYKYEVKPDVIWVPENCRVVAFVNSDPTEGTKRVFQAGDAKLIGE